MTKSEFKKYIERGRNAYIKANAITVELFNKIENDFFAGEPILEDIPCNSENSDNISDAICCYLQYGEYDPDSIWDDLIEEVHTHS